MSFAQIKQQKNWESSLRFCLSCIMLACFIFLAGCDTFLPPAVPTLTEKEAKQTKVSQEQTEKPPEPTPTVTPTPLPSVIVGILGGYMVNVDPMDRILETKFETMDAWYGQDANGAMIFRITVNCDGLCSRERTFEMTIKALRVTLGAMDGMLPKDIVELQIVTLNRFQPSGMVIVKWKDASDYCSGIISDTQLAGRIVRP